MHVQKSHHLLKGANQKKSHHLLKGANQKKSHQATRKMEFLLTFLSFLIIIVSTINKVGDRF